MHDPRLALKRRLLLQGGAASALAAAFPLRALAADEAAKAGDAAISPVMRAVSDYIIDA